MYRSVAQCDMFLYTMKYGHCSLFSHVLFTTLTVLSCAIVSSLCSFFSKIRAWSVKKDLHINPTNFI